LKANGDETHESHARVQRWTNIDNILALSYGYPHLTIEKQQQQQTVAVMVAVVVRT